MLAAYRTAILGDSVLPALSLNENELSRMSYDLSYLFGAEMLDRYLTRLLFEWADHPSGHAVLDAVVSPRTIMTMSELFRAADLSRPASAYPVARAAKPRKVIMHVGPTNSGKTHNALRALAGAQSGVYAGPLRLLAHEIWERLNKGQIVPLGVEMDAHTEPDTRTNFDVGGPAIRKEASPQYARACNLLTGEEQKIVMESGALLSCTVEMVSVNAEYDVAVVDEIQMLADPDRGGAWSNAVLGISARELHLCGEETAVPLVEAMLRDTGDELIVNRYRRLTPLQAADEGLKNDLNLVQKGDCVVCFSRTKIFTYKKRIEEATGMRCAVAYGRLPPEIRSEQAALFNDPDSGYDILVASDAVGMGLNLKIKRIIFDTVRKYDGNRLVLLSTSQIKQIAGRAGRYGLHGKDEAGGIVTAMQDADLPDIRRALAAPMQPLRYARVQLLSQSIRYVMNTLPPGVSLQIAVDVYHYVAKLHPSYEIPDTRDLENRISLIDPIGKNNSFNERMLLHMAPVPQRDPLAQDVLRCIVRTYNSSMRVSLRKAFQEAGVWDQYQDILTALRESKIQGDKSVMLGVLETVHKVIVMYLWLSYRQGVAFPDQEDAFLLKEETEAAMDTLLQALTPSSVGKRHTRARRDDGLSYKSLKEFKQELYHKKSEKHINSVQSLEASTTAQ
ncbi:uncharacterized protein FIBRA_06750 [Fibroporia radiculosa]|uniref:RNA helicase n=1 Tax=Fibroporia radiculosa TaxID=599839 RepID=J4H488_9APHY|nr:uncharacterized protein FIBRA_06750 [Fibroporia radiculosa]CCM04569.1 predicted protein [Fibroporia radiculosa]